MTTPAQEAPYPSSLPPTEYVALEAVDVEEVQAYPVDDAIMADQEERVRVRAPSPLTAGQEVTVRLGDRLLVVQVPESGAMEGEIFQATVLRSVHQEPRSVVLDNEEQEGLVTALNRNDNPHNIPQGHWRDGFCACCSHGACHPHCCLAWWCAPLALGQVMTRLRLDACGNPPEPQRRRQRSRSSCSWSPFYILLALTLLFIVTDHVLSIIIMAYIHVDDDGTVPSHQRPQHDIPGWVVLLLTFRSILRCSMLLYLLIATIRTRYHVRQQYRIPAGGCCCQEPCDDCCSSFWCHCCTVTQMMRHTADYSTYRASCCSETGLPPSVPSIV